MQATSCLVTAPPTSCRCNRLQAAAATPKALALNSTTTCTAVSSTSMSYEGQMTCTRREALMPSMSAAAAFVLVSRPPAALAADDEEYVKETSEVIKRVRSTIGIDKTDPNVESAVAELRDASNSWVAKYRREKALLGRPSFRDVYSALNAVSGHYISFGPTAPIPAKRRTRILEEVDTAEKAPLRGR